MKNIPVQLVNTFKKPGRSTCFFVKVVCKDGDVFGFSSLDASLWFDDEEHNVWYRATKELLPQNIQQEANFSVDNTVLQGWFGDDMAKQVLAGKFDFAEITIYRVAYLRLSQGFEIVGYGTVGEVTFNADKKDKRKVEFRSLMQQLKQIVTEYYSLTCRADYGDSRCGMPLDWANGVVTAIGMNPYLSFTSDAPAQPDGFYELGVLEFLTGDNTGYEVEVEYSWNDGRVQLSFLPPYPVSVNDQLRIRQDCGKTEADCLAKDNIINMRAEHLTPVEDASIMVPGAYIKSSGAL